MDIEDVKVGMLVQMNNNTSKSGCVGEVEHIDYVDELVMLRLEGVTTDSGYNTNTVHNRWKVRPCRFDEYQDPEADMVVWDALEFGEHFIAPSGCEAMKVNSCKYVLVGGDMLHPVKTPQLFKFKLA